MNEEEKKAIEDMNRFANGIDMSCVTARQMQIILNLIEKLQKENDKLNIKLDDKEAEIQILKDDIKADDIEYKHVIEILKKENEEYSKQLDLDYVDKNYISKKKIEDTIEELKGKLEDISKRRQKLRKRKLCYGV